MFCDKCGTQLDDNVKICPQCGAGTTVKKPDRRCTLCGNIVSAELHFCSFCGDDLTEQTVTAEPDMQAEKTRRTNTQTDDTAYTSNNARSNTSEPERELYRSPLVTYGKGMMSPSGKLIITNKAIRFEPIGMIFASSKFSLSMNEIVSAQKSKTYGMVPGSLQINTRDGRIMNFVFGAVRSGDIDRVISLINQTKLTQ